LIFTEALSLDSHSFCFLDGALETGYSGKNHAIPTAQSWMGPLFYQNQIHFQNPHDTHTSADFITQACYKKVQGTRKLSLSKEGL
jgi:hypothetical protein